MAQAPRPGGAYFEKKGEVHELRVLLRGAAVERDQQKKRDAIKKVIAYMTLGIDVSPLFSEMVMASATQDLVQKKMVYLYLVNYAESNSELAILAVNTLHKDCRDDDPMIRGLALRSLCSLNVVNMVEYLQPAVQRALEDVNGYVRKTAVIGVIKLFHISRSAVLDTDVLPTLKRLAMDSDSHVVSNTLMAVEEVLADEGGFQPSREHVTHLLNRIASFSEWGQCAVLRILSKYQVQDENEMFDIMNILDCLLKQSSSAVVLSVTKIFVDLTSNRPDLQAEVLRRLRGPLLTLMAASTPELAYTVLVHIQALVSRGGANHEVFGPEFKQFFCRFNEPSYIKNVKIDILTTLADSGSAEPIVAELSEYVTDVDVEISRRAIRAIGKIAVRVPSTAELVVGSLTNLLELDIDYVSTEAAVVMKDLVRKYPQQFQRASGAVERCMRIVNEPEGKCAVLWILGEYGLLIEDAPYLLEPMIDGFLEETSGSVRLEMLTAAVKLFFCRPPETQKMLGRLLQKAIQETTHPDVHDRAILYYRLLEISPEEARRVVCAPKEVVEEFQEEMDADIKERIFEEFNTLSTVYKQPATKFVLSKEPSGLGAIGKMQPPPAPEDMQARLDAQAQQSSLAEVPSFARVTSPEENGSTSEAMLPGFFEPEPARAAPQSADLLGENDDDVLGAPPARETAVTSLRATSTNSGMTDLLGMEDLLGGGDPVPQSPQVSFTLSRDAAMDGQTFQARWAQLPQPETKQRSMRPVPLAAVSTAAVEEALRRVCINVIASGNIPPGQAMKFYFYARQASGPPATSHGDVWFLTELILVPGGSAQAVVKVENGQAASSESFLALLWEALQAYVM
mmetsp:Transcript_39931/g.87163  ORF Transcript_39931/g.87163 Transcript_39931/m.87163 type:complete len:851 (+) Transcript_39931:130-2682(+)